MYTVIRVFEFIDDVPVSVWTVADSAEQLYNTVRDRKDSFTTSSYVLQNGKWVLQRLDKWMRDREDEFGK